MKYLLRKNVLRQCRLLSGFALALAISTFQLSAKAQSLVIEGYDIIVIAGQSNASGYGNTPVPPGEEINTTLDGKIYQVKHQSATGCPDGTTLDPAIVPITKNDGRYSRHSLSHRDLGCGLPNRNGFGLTFARRYAEQRLGPNRGVLIVPVAYGSTTSYDWLNSEPWKSGESKSLKQYMYDHINTARAAKNSAGGAGNNRVVALLWSQGEWDIEFCGGALSATDHCKYGATTDDAGQAQVWKNRTLEIFDKFRAKFPTDYPAIIATGFAPQWLPCPNQTCRKNIFYNALKAAQSTIPRFRVTATDEPTGDLESNPSIFPDENYVHFSTAAQIKLGKRMWVSYGDTLRGTPSDFNADRKSDLLFRNGTTGDLVGNLMNGTNVASSAQLPGIGSAWSVTHAADFDGNGKADLALSHSDGRMVVWLMNGTTVTSSAQLLDAYSGWSITHTGDFNGDGKADLALRHSDGRIDIVLMNGQSSTIRSTMPLGAGSGWSITHAADFDGDGKTDLLLRHIDGRVVVWLMDGTNVASSFLLPAGDSGLTPTHTGDLNADGKADILFRNTTDGRVVAYLMDGGVVKTNAVLVGAGAWWVNQVADYNGDGKADLLCRNNDGTLVIFTMNGLAITGDAVILNANTVWTPERGGDYNGDGMADIILRKNDVADRTIRMYLMNGSAIIGEEMIIPPVQYTVVSALP
jgi:hypothetical protein